MLPQPHTLHNWYLLTHFQSFIHVDLLIHNRCGKWDLDTLPPVPPLMTVITGRRLLHLHPVRRPYPVSLRRFSVIGTPSDIPQSRIINNLDKIRRFRPISAVFHPPVSQSITHRKKFAQERRLCHLAQFRRETK